MHFEFFDYNHKNIALLHIMINFNFFTDWGQTLKYRYPINGLKLKLSDPSCVNYCDR